MTHPIVAEDSAGFKLDQRLQLDTQPVMRLGLCELRIMDDCRWPWLVLVPQRPGAEEVHDLTPLDQTLLAFETNMTAETLKSLTNCTKINTGALGNIVRQMHVHIIARSEGDPNWPGPVWGFGSRQPYPRDSITGFCRRLREKVCPDAWN